MDINTSYGDGRSIIENICILVVEDDKEINYLIANYLRKEGYIVDCSFDGMEAEDVPIKVEKINISYL